MRILATLLLVATLGACSDPYGEAMKADTIEAFEKYLDENPEGTKRLEAETRLEALLFEKAKADRTLAAYDHYLERFPEGRRKDDIHKDREGALFEETRRVNTLEAWQHFLAEYPKADRGRKSKAKAMIKAIEYSSNLALTEPVITQVNLAEDPKGPLDGWGFTVDVTNKGTDTIESLWLTIEYLDDTGRALVYKDWPVVAPYNEWPTPIEDEHTVPLKAGASHTWSWSAGDLPASWSKKVKVYPSLVRVAGGSEKTADAE